MNGEKDMIEEVESMVKEARSAKMDVVFATCHVDLIPQFAGTITKPRVPRFCGLIENLAAVT